MIRICVAGATGRMGRVLIEEALNGGFRIVGAVAAPDDANIGCSITELGIGHSDTVVKSQTELRTAVREADVYVSFTTPQAEVSNLPIVAEQKKRIVTGTTGFTDRQMEMIRNEISEKVPAVFAPNFAVGVNILFRLAKICRAFPPDYDFSIIEIHHKGKKDAPSGTAKKLGAMIANLRKYSKTVYGREGLSSRTPEELEILSLRSGGITGIHEILISGPYETVKIEHTAFSRKVFAQGTLWATRWIYNQKKPGIYGMEDVLSVSEDEKN